MNGSEHVVAQVVGAIVAALLGGGLIVSITTYVVLRKGVVTEKNCDLCRGGIKEDIKGICKKIDDMTHKQDKMADDVGFIKGKINGTSK